METKIAALKDEDGHKVIAAAIKRVKENPEQLGRLMASPLDVLREVAAGMGIELDIPPDLSVAVLRETRTQRYLVLPFDGDMPGTTHEPKKGFGF